MDEVTIVSCALEKTLLEINYFPKVIKEGVGKALAARLFEQLAYEHVCSLLPSFRTALSPTDTFGYFRKIYPSNRVLKDVFGPKHIQDAIVPDGLAFDTRWSEYPGHRGLCKVYEYSLLRWGFDRYFNRKLLAFSKLKETRPKLFKFASLSIVILAEYERELPRKSPPYVHFETVPVSAYTIRKVVTEYIKNRGA